MKREEEQSRARQTRREKRRAEKKIGEQNRSNKRRGVIKNESIQEKNQLELEDNRKRKNIYKRKDKIHE